MSAHICDDRQASYDSGALDRFETGAITIARTIAPLKRKWTAEQLRKLPSDKRDAILRAASKSAEREYRDNPDFSAFDAFGKDDLHGESSSAEAR